MNGVDCSLLEGHDFASGHSATCSFGLINVSALPTSLWTTFHCAPGVSECLHPQTVHIPGERATGAVPQKRCTLTRHPCRSCLHPFRLEVSCVQSPAPHPASHAVFSPPGLSLPGPTCWRKETLPPRVVPHSPELGPRWGARLNSAVNRRCLVPLSTLLCTRAVLTRCTGDCTAPCDKPQRILFALVLYGEE